MTTKQQQEIEERMLRYAMARAMDALPPFQALRAVLTIATRHERYIELTRNQRDSVVDALHCLPPETFPGAPGSRIKEGG